MTRHSWPTLQVVKRAAAFKLRQLWDELAMLMGSFPDLRDAFDRMTNALERVKQPSRVLIFGSLYLAGEVLKANEEIPD